VLADREIQAEKDRIGSPIIENISHINLVRAPPRNITPESKILESYLFLFKSLNKVGLIDSVLKEGCS